jgi:hypothetical protein
MSFKVENYYDGSWVDISDYVLEGTSDIPFVSRNRDWSIRCESMKFIISGALEAVRGAGYNFSKGDAIKVTEGGDYLWGGYVWNSKLSKGKGKYEVNTFDSLRKLQGVKVESSTLDTRFSAGTEWWEYCDNDYYNHPVVGVFFALKCMFEAVGLSLDMSDVEDTKLFTAPLTGHGDFNCDINYKYLFMDKYAIWSVNQQVAATDNELNSGANDYGSMKITMFDFVSEVLSMLWLALRQTGIDSWKLVKPTANYYLGDDYKYDYDEDMVEGLEQGLGIQYSEMYIDRYSYSLVPTEISNKNIGSGGEIVLMNNLEMLYSDAVNNTNKYEERYAFCRLGIGLSINATVYSSATVVRDWSFPDWSLYDEDATRPNVSRCKFLAKGSDYTKVKAEVNMLKPFNTANENSIEIKTRVSKIVQEIL